ncbi:MAG: hypothetical protein KKG33_02880 [candidate division Zixibacteria bacterium]|nr:hypothetical protein [candidate division Zixibacteria bacterium]MBU1470754.1 hypothetical protein [candidate division Zixibacteria bacterium]MBU2624486.1 hypothetical protein [candidate division Zixibacteria bacterium]
MTRLVLIAAVILLLVASVVQAQMPEEDSADSLVIAWTNGFSEAQAQGLSENRVILLDFYTDS